jgi:hypothetical protein
MLKLSLSILEEFKNEERTFIWGTLTVEELEYEI